MARAIKDGRLEDAPSGPAGLTTAAALARRRLYGENIILTSRRARWSDVARDAARDPMAWFLVAAAALYLWTGEIAEAAVLAGALIPIMGMDAFLHWRTQASTQGLKSRLAARARVRRDGADADIDARDLVPGDLVEVRAGEAFPADGLVVLGEALHADESLLTGEAAPVVKRAMAGAAPRAGAVIDNAHWTAAGSRLLTGRALVRIVYTGGDTLYGEIARSVQEGRAERTPLQRAVADLVSVLLGAAVLACAALAATRLMQGRGLVDALMSAVTLAVAAIPEEFPVVFTFFLGVGVYRLARRQALVRRAVAVENIGRVTCICSDKTGTLTEGRLSLAHVVPGPGLERDDVLRIAAIASREDSADPMDQSVLETARARVDRVFTFPFTEVRRREAAIVRDGAHWLIAVKGAPETVLALSSVTAEEAAAWRGQMESLAASAHKIVLCAKRSLETWPVAEPDSGYDIVGLVAFEDSIRAGVAEAVEAAQDAGIRVIMVTGDYASTARAVAAALHLGGDEPFVVEGGELAKRLASEGASALEAIDVVARATPMQKFDLVEALRRSGEIVAVTGDGVNDAPALRAADIGIAMGAKGAQTSREVASIVLLDDSFRTIVRAIGEGRQLFANLERAFAYLLIAHIPLVVTAAVIPLSGAPLLYLPAHVVWLELIFHPTALLVFQALPARARLAPARRAPARQFFTAQQWIAITFAAAVISLLIIIAYDRALATGAEHARSVALALLIASGAAAAGGLSGLRTAPSWIALAAPILSALVFIQSPPLAMLLHLSPLHGDDWLIAVAGGLATGAAAAAGFLLAGRASLRNAGFSAGDPERRRDRR